MNETRLPPTERVNARSQGLDTLPTAQMVEIFVDEQHAAVNAVLARTDELARVVDEVAERLHAGGRLHYVGAGTSGRLGFLDASEMPPTFGTPRELVCAHIAGGVQALTHAIEGAEDDAQAGAQEMRGHVAPGDAVVGISASGGAPFVVGAIEASREIGAFTVGVANNDDAPLLRVAHVGISLMTGAEPLTGSTRLKAGTSQKVLLNALSTAVMVRLGKVHDNLMVDLVATNKKLRDRSLRLVERLSGVDRARAQDLLDAADGRVKVAVVMGVRNVDAATARRLLEEHRGLLRPCIT